jgi:tetratricopeptide (TPR) repeat protein
VLARNSLTFGVLLCLVLIFNQFAFAEDAAELMEKADQLYLQRAEKGKAAEAARIYEAILKADPGNSEAAWKRSRTLFWVGGHSPEEKRLEIYSQAVEAAKQAIKSDPKSVDGHFWLGANYGFYGNAKGVMESLSLIDPIKEEMAAVMELDPVYAHGGPDRVLGRLYFKVPGLFGGDNDLAMEHLEKAIKAGPNYFLNHIYLAEVYLDEDKKDKARALLQKVVAGPPTKGMEPEYVDWKATAQKMLDGI